MPEVSAHITISTPGTCPACVTEFATRLKRRGRAAEDGTGFPSMPTSLNLVLESVVTISFVKHRLSVHRRSAAKRSNRQSIQPASVLPAALLFRPTEEACRILYAHLAAMLTTLQCCCLCALPCKQPVCHSAMHPFYARPTGGSTGVRTELSMTNRPRILGDR